MCDQHAVFLTGYVMAQAYRRNLSSLWSSMHYILRTARCLHAWRSDTVAALKQRQAEKHEAELAALRNNRGDDDFLNETRSLKEQVKQKSATLRDKEDQIDALTWEGRRKDTDLNRLEKENDELRQTVLKHDYELKRQAIQSDTRDELAAKVLLLQELQKRTEADHNRDIASYREQLETNRAEIQLLNAQIREKEQASQTAHQERGAVVDAMHTKLEQQLKHEIQFMNDSMAVLEEKYKLQEEELNKLRQYAPLSQQRELELSKEAGEIKQKLTEQVKQLKANLENVEWERAKQQEELVLTRGAMRRLEDVRESLALKTHELTVAQVCLSVVLLCCLVTACRESVRMPNVSRVQADIARLTEEARATAKFYHDYEEELKKATKDGDNNEKDTVKTVTQMHEMLIGELRKVNTPSCSSECTSVPSLCIPACFDFDNMTFDVSGTSTTFRICVQHSKSR